MVCSHSGCPELAVAYGRCREHLTEYERWQRATVPTKRTRDWAERKRRAEAVRSWVALNGWWCPGFGRAPHEVTDGDLTAEHSRPVADAGEGAGPLTVLCRSCNSRHGQATGQRYRT